MTLAKKRDPKMQLRCGFAACLAALVLLLTANPTFAQSTPPATAPDGTPIPASSVLLSVLDEARRVCVPITNGQFTDTTVVFDTPSPVKLQAVVDRLGLGRGPTNVVIHSTPPMLTPPTVATRVAKSPPRGVDVTASISINRKSNIATMTGLPSDARNSMIDTGGNTFALAAWDADHWVTIGVTVDSATAKCPVGWFAPNASTFFAYGNANPIFTAPGWRTRRWPTWTVRLPMLPAGWYRLTTDVALTSKIHASAGTTFRV